MYKEVPRFYICIQNYIGELNLPTRRCNGLSKLLRHTRAGNLRLQINRLLYFGQLYLKPISILMEILYLLLILRDLPLGTRGHGVLTSEILGVSK